MKKKAVTAFLKILVIAVCLAVLSRKLHLADIRSTLSRVHLLYLLPALAMILVEPVVMACKWNVLLRQKGIHAGLLNLARLIFTSNFVAIALPTSVGADALRIYLLRRQKHSLTDATASLVADRLVALTTLALLSVLGIVVVWRLVSGRHVLAVVLSTCALALAIVAALASNMAFHVCQGISRMIAGSSAGPERFRRTLQRITQLVEDIHASARRYTGMPRVLALVFLLNVVVQMLRTFQIHFIFRSLGVAVPVFQEFAFVPMIILLTLLPISYFGLGIKEGAFAYFFSAVAIPPSVSVSVSLITYPLIVLGLLPGAAFLAMRNPADGGASPASEEPKT